MRIKASSRVLSVGCNITDIFKWRHKWCSYVRIIYLDLSVVCESVPALQLEEGMEKHSGVFLIRVCICPERNKSTRISDGSQRGRIFRKNIDNMRCLKRNVIWLWVSIYYEYFWGKSEHNKLDYNDPVRILYLVLCRYSQYRHTLSQI